MDDKLKKWREDMNYLPDMMKDFHDGKDIFKTVHRMTNVEGHEYAKDINWVAGQCYVVDIFLWFMARHGYTLQKCRAKQNFESLEDAVLDTRDRISKMPLG